MKADYMWLLAVLGIVIFLSGCVAVDKSIEVNINLNNVECGKEVCGEWPVWVWIDYSTESEQDVSPNTTTKLK